MLQLCPAFCRGALDLLAHCGSPILDLKAELFTRCWRQQDCYRRSNQGANQYPNEKTQKSLHTDLLETPAVCIPRIHTLLFS
jgi:hypothetical protein